MIVDLKSWNHPRIPEIAGFLSQDVARLGVTCVETPEGVTEDVWEEGVTICIQTKRCNQYTTEHCVGEKELKTNKTRKQKSKPGNFFEFRGLGFLLPTLPTFCQRGRLALPRVDIMSDVFKTTRWHPMMTLRSSNKTPKSSSLVN